MTSKTSSWNRLRYSLYAPFYDLAGRRLDRGRQISIDALALRPAERVVVPGCGTGLDFRYLAPDLFVTAGDLSPAMVRRARARSAKLKLDVDVRLMDAHALDLPDGHFDAAILHLIVAVVPDPHALLREVFRVLKPGGRVGVFDKFLPEDVEPSLPRRAVNAVANVIASDLNRKIEPLASEAGLTFEREAGSLFGGLFKIVILRKPD